MKKTHFIFFGIIALLLIIVCPSIAQTVLTADGPGNTYELINSVFAPNGGDVVETPDCAHPEFGRHIAEVWDGDLQKYVFEFYIHVTPDNDRCINYDRQRVEIKTYEQSPETLKGISGETVVYKWLFKIPQGFQPSSNFTHLHQIKPVGGDEATPIFTLTARKGTPNQLELNHYVSTSQNSTKLKSIQLSLLENKWVEVTEQIKIDSINGTYSITIRRLSDDAVLLNYTNSKILTIRPNNSFIRPKWGIYRSLLSSQDLRDEAVRFSDFSIQEINTSGFLKNDLQQFTISNSVNDRNLKVNFSLCEFSDVAFSLLSMNGQTVQVFPPFKNLPSGNHSLELECGLTLKGMYLLSMCTNSRVMSRKVIF